MPDIRQALRALVRRILEGMGVEEPVKREAAFKNSGLAEPLSTLVDKVARHAFRVTDEDIAAAILCADHFVDPFVKVPGADGETIAVEHRRHAHRAVRHEPRLRPQAPRERGVRRRSLRHQVRRGAREASLSDSSTSSSSRPRPSAPCAAICPERTSADCRRSAWTRAALESGRRCRAVG